MWEDKTGVSPIIAVILMVAITVVLAATIYVWVSGFGGGGAQQQSVGLQQTDHNGTQVTYKVTGAEGFLWSDSIVMVNGAVVAGYSDAYNIPLYFTDSSIFR